MSKYRVIDYKQVNKIIYKHHLHIPLKKSTLKRFTSKHNSLHASKLNQFLESQNSTINTQLIKYFSSHLKLLPKVLSRPYSFYKATLYGILGCIPELRNSFNVHSYYSSTGHLYFIFHKANHHSQQYWNTLLNRVCKLTKLPIFRQTFFAHNLDPFYLNFTMMYFNQESPVVYNHFINEVPDNKFNTVQKLSYVVNNVHRLTVSVCLNKLIQTMKIKRIKTNISNNIALYNYKNHHILIKSKKLIQQTENER